MNGTAIYGRAELAGRRRLVFCRSGEGSLHRRWIGDPATRSYDVWLDCYCDPSRWAQEAARVTDGRGTTKWPRIATLLAANAALFERYDVVWFPDDDLAIDASDVERFFELFERYGLSLAQPALTIDCEWSHEITLAFRGFVLRYTNFVEVMAPAFAREALKACAPTFAETSSGWGIDFVWARVLGERPDAIAVVDATPMTHTRPIGSAYALDGARSELAAVLSRHGVALPFRYLCHAAVRVDAHGVADGLARGARLRILLLRGAPSFVKRLKKRACWAAREVRSRWRRMR